MIRSLYNSTCVCAVVVAWFKDLKTYQNKRNGGIGMVDISDALLSIAVTIHMHSVVGPEVE